jgi:hypothetical protein
MAQALYSHLFSTKTLVRVAFAALSLPSMGSAWAQGLPAGTMAPVYGTAWSAAQAGSHSSNTPTLASEQSKTGRVEAARTPDSHVRLSFHRTGGG